jgi:CRISPR/Cas system-associated exonuclease Cas4 (RecB family)
MKSFEDKKEDNEKISGVIERFSRHNPQPKVEAGSYRCSSIPGCIRKSFYWFKQPREFPCSTLKIFRAGKNVHEAVEESFDTFGGFDSVEREVSVMKEFGDPKSHFKVTGTLDLIVEEKGKRRVVEFKSAKTLWKFDADNEVCIYNPPNEFHLDQITLYMGLAKINSGWIIYIQKNDLATKVYSVEFSKKRFDKLIDRTRELHRCLEENTLPDPESKNDESRKWECKSCIYKKECRGDVRL